MIMFFSSASLGATVVMVPKGCAVDIRLVGLSRKPKVFRVSALGAHDEEGRHKVRAPELAAIIGDFLTTFFFVVIWQCPIPPGSSFDFLGSLLLELV